MAVFGEGLVAAQATSAFAVALCAAVAAAGRAAEVSVCLFQGLTAAELLAGADMPELRDMRGRRGPGLRELQTDILLLAAGSCDLGLRDASPEEVLSSMRGLVHEAKAVAKQVFVMALPDVNKSAQRASFVGSTLAARRCATNSSLSRWIDGELDGAEWVNPAALLPFGPRSVAAGYWDGSLLSERGAQALAGRLASSILPVLENATAQSESKMLDGLVGESVDDQSEGAAQLPSLDAFLEAFRMEDEASGIVSGEDEQQMHRFQESWQV
ncbi:unnamed protein product [Symbiodinium pilosum]|uniref:Uncharacterized protein n=1 Tax=Symbiodinium pilosum TaxID=2952 RepID=A0A812XPV7_SYMPI|nr:unnamed protein product [Symbiodinium pilosum]